MACAATPAFPDLVVTRAEYLESGSVAVRRKFPDWQPPPPLREAAKEKPRDAKEKRQDAKEKRTQDTATAKGKGKQHEREEPAVGPRTRIRAVNPVAPARKPR
jgi:hypothetical protein